MTNSGLEILKREVSDRRAEGKYRETIEKGYILLEQAKRSSDSKSMLAAYLNIAASYYFIGDIEEAFRCIESYREVCDAQGDESDQLSLYHVLFLLYEYNKDYPRAKETLWKTIRTGEQLQKHNLISVAYGNMSHVYLMEQRFAEALETANKALDHAKQSEVLKPIRWMKIRMNVIKAQIGLGNFKDSGEGLAGLLNDPILDEFIPEKAQCYSIQGTWYTEQKRYKEAFAAYTSAKESAESYKDMQLLQSVEKERCRLCELMEDIQLGYAVQKQYIQLLNEIHHSELALAALKLDIKHNIVEYERKANTDYLTGLYNRSFIEITTNKWLKQAALTHDKILCLAFDIDDFKSINDSNGHLFGDEAIKLVSQACSKVFREEDLVGRYGGDEFVILIQGGSLEIGEKKAMQLQQALAAIEFEGGAATRPLTISIGISDNLNGKVKSFKELFHMADTCLYKAKQNGKNQIVLA
ncbi:MAG TPA: diguanylate cyclase [Planococcus sp. (in: firmicutes)]|nr:diguanylate cyclase [Planococcus sp. (in: firmicutes)]